jgi:DNA-binding XRE family transcriptional regulator
MPRDDDQGSRLSVKVIELDRRKYAILPLDRLEDLLKELEDRILIDEFERALATGKVERVSDEEMYEIFHKSPIRIAREKAGLTQAELAEIMGVSQPQVSKWEKVGYNPRKNTLEKICRALEVPIEEVL